MFSLRKYAGKKLVSYARQGDFAHAGEEDAIELVMKKYDKNINNKILDAGCGLGATANYIQEHGWGTVTGFDIESESIEHAAKHYSSIDFYASDVNQIDSLLPQIFDIICMFNSFYAFNDQSTALSALNNIAIPSSQLAIFDYSIESKNNENKFYREASKDQISFKPIVINEIESLLISTKWRMKNLVNISDKYLRWYSDLLNKLEKYQDNIVSEFGENAFVKAIQTYSDIHSAILKNELGGVVVYAEKC